MDEKDINRFLLQFEQLLRTENRDHINPRIEELAVEDLKPIVEMVARSRAMYLEHLYKLCQKYEGSEELPSNEEMQRLRAYRNRFIELADGSKSFEISIQRGYLDLKLD